MKTQHLANSPPESSGRKYESVTAMMRGEGFSPAIQDKVAELAAETRITLQLAQMRHRAGVTQKQMADALGLTQGAISKLEAGKDEDLTLKHVMAYARVTGERIGLMAGKPLSPAEAVNLHVDALKLRLEQLADGAAQNDIMQAKIKGFLGEAFFNLFKIITLCSQKLPQGENDVEVRIEMVQCGESPIVAGFNMRTAMPTKAAA